MEFTPELNKDYLSHLLNPIDEGGARDEGRARSEAAARGLTGQSLEGSMIGASRVNTARERGDAISKFNFDVAGMNRSERLTHEKQAYDSTEAEKDRAFREHMTKLGFEFQSNERNNQNRADKIGAEQGMVESYGATLASKSLGSYFGGVSGGN